MNTDDGVVVPHQQALLDILDGIGLVFVDAADNNDGVCATPLASLLVSISATSASKADDANDIVGANALESTAAQRSLRTLHDNARPAPAASSSSTATAMTAATRGYVIVETNFRVYAYTDSPIDIAILSMFIQPTVRLVSSL
jgi:cytolysin (calcineurin-like family phosphatase)